ncbi:hypothetical protein N5876_32385 (plasmid) [Pseudomonas aeruginosa]|jgi:hypothetical protein|uniref:hypothetical protein n=1 Tax=Pseudomonas aeruginosa TaxID=287 RepID=UPI0021184794|nr:MULTISPECIES: hypothetical protein [Pseudomonas aeruginosa group]UXH55973.1 hypothetical protein N5876_32385 [Pseudomonas aeruginosa]UXH69032.1 hypothetical protein N5879_32560 [Pseudomonas aeruginosa]
MFKKVFIDWFVDLLKGVGGSLLAGALVLIVTPAYDPLTFTFTVVVGAMMYIAALVLGLVMAIPESPEAKASKDD